MSPRPDTVSGAESGLIFDIQHYAVHDGPGIRTLVFLKGCPLRCVWCCNPEAQSFRPELRHSAVRCKASLRCAQRCPHGAVSAGAAGPIFDRDTCAECAGHPCVEECWNGALEVCGREMTARDVVDTVARDLDFYRNSGGGLTLSGGEPLAQPAFSLAILMGCKAKGIHTAVETCGHVATTNLLHAAPWIDLFLFDVKVMDCARHEALTGIGNALILRNLRTLARDHAARITLRYPVIPGCTDDDDNAKAIGALALELGVPRVELEGYHTLGWFKYAELGREPDLNVVESEQTLDRVLQIRRGFAELGVFCDMARG